MDVGTILCLVFFALCTRYAGCNGSTRETNAERAALRAAFPRSYLAGSARGPQSAVGRAPSLQTVHEACKVCGLKEPDGSCGDRRRWSRVVVVRVSVGMGVGAHPH